MVVRLARYNLRSDKRLNFDILDVPPFAPGPHKFAVSGPTLWNSLLNSLKDCVSLSAFKAGLETYLFKKAFE